MNLRSFLAVTLAAFTLLMGCSGRGGPSPEQIATRWRWAVAKGDVGTEWDLEGPGLQPRAGDRTAGIEFLRGLYKPPAPDHQVVAVKAVRTVKDSSDQQDKYVFVYLQVTERDYPAEQETVTLRKVDGAWRVAKWQP